VDKWPNKCKIANYLYAWHKKLADIKKEACGIADEF